MNVLRITPAFDHPDSAIARASGASARLGTIRTHAGALTRALDSLGVEQVVVTAADRGAGRRTRVGRLATVWSTGARSGPLTQLWGAGAGLLAQKLDVPTSLVHAHVGGDSATAPIAWAAARARRVPLLVTLHSDPRRSGSDPTGVSHSTLTVLRHADGVIALTADSAARIEAAGVDERRISVIPSGVDPAMFDREVDDPLPWLRRPRVVFAGGLNAGKGVDVLIRAATLLRTPDVRVVVVGDGPERRRLQQLAYRLGVEERVFFRGAVPQREVAAILRHAQLAVLPARRSEFPSVALEAMQARVPVVATRVGGHASVVRDGETGLMVPACDPLALAQAIDRVLADPVRAAVMGANGGRAAGSYHWTTIARRILAGYDDVMRRDQPVTSPSDLVWPVHAVR